MKLLDVSKDGGPLSTVTGLFLIEAKRLFSVAVLHFADGSRDAYHDHAFHAVSWVLRGKLKEHMLDGEVREHTPSFCPILTPRDCFHKVVSEGDTWVVTFRGPWSKTWREYLPGTQRFVTLAKGRRVVHT